MCYSSQIMMNVSTKMDLHKINISDAAHWMGFCLCIIINIESKPKLLNELPIFRKVWSKLVSSSKPSWNNKRYCYCSLENVSFMRMILMTFIWTTGQRKCFQVHHITTNLHYASNWRRQANIAWNILPLDNIHYSFIHLQGQGVTEDPGTILGTLGMSQGSKHAHIHLFWIVNLPTACFER